jgi:DNA-3-methyladenine glycosylase II
MSIRPTITLRFTGDYDLNASVTLAKRAAFASELRAPDGPDGPHFFDLVFPIEGSWNAIGVSIGQQDGRVEAQVVANPGHVPDDMIRDRLEHILALNVDGAGFADLAQQDAVIAGLQNERRGVRPVLFPSPYEAAARAIIGHRLHVNQAAALHRQIASEYGVAVEIGGRTIHAFPAPSRLAELAPVQGLADKKVEQLRALGVAAVEGWLNTSRMQAMSHGGAMAHLQQLGGIGPFSAELILMRGVGDPDAFPVSEMRLHRAMAAAYQLAESPELATLQSVAEGWRPYRSWVGLLLRNHNV